MRVLNVQKLIDTQSQKHRERLLSQFSRLLDSTPSFVTYYSIDGVNSTSEMGTRDIMQYVGDDSPIKFKKITNMPIYALNAVTANIEYDETMGTYTEFEDQSLILNSVLRPLPGDHFVVESFNPEIIFAISDVKMRAIRGEDHYVVDYTVMQSSRILNIERQVVESYETIFRNIGTEDKVLIKDSEYYKLRDYMESYRYLHERYIDENYDDDIGYLKTPDLLEGREAYGTCKYLIKFLMDHRIVYFDEILESIFAFEIVLPFESRHNKLYNRTFPLNGFIRKRVKKGSAYVTFKSMPISLFKEVSDEKIEQSIEFPFIAHIEPPVEDDNGDDTIEDEEDIIDDENGEDQESGNGEDEEDMGMTSIDVDEPELPVIPDNSVLLYDAEFIETLLSGDYEDMSPITKVLAKHLRDDDIDPIEYEDCIDDYEVSDLMRYYFIPFILLLLKVKIKSMQVAGNK